MFLDAARIGGRSRKKIVPLYKVSPLLYFRFPELVILILTTLLPLLQFRRHRSENKFTQQGPVVDF
jgi:hypothetical protein